MNPGKGWSYHTMEGMRWNTWTRKRRRKFKKRWYAQHGHRFRFYAVEWKFIPITLDGGPKELEMIFFERDPKPTCEV